MAAARGLLGEPQGPIQFDPDQLPALFREGLKTVYLHQAVTQGIAEARPLYLEEVARQGHWKFLLREVDTVFSERGLRTIVFKGGSLMDWAYPAWTLRPLSDLDLAVPPQDLEHVREILTGIGYTVTNERPLVLSRDGWSLDVHTDPLNQYGPAFPVMQDEAWNGASPVGEAGAVLRMSPEKELLVALLHACKHSFQRLIWLVDIALLLRQVSPESTYELLRRTGATRYLRYGLWLISELLIEPDPSWDKAEPAWERLNFIERTFLRYCRQGDAPETLGMLVPAFSLPNWYLRGRYLASALYPDREHFVSRTLHLLRLFRRVVGIEPKS